MSDNDKDKDLLYDKEEFLDYRKSQEAAHFDRYGNKTDVLASILTIEINTTELCNRKCVFCPRYNEAVYPNRNLHMSVQSAEVIAKNIAEINYQGKISFSGFGENLLNKDFIKIVQTFRENLPHAKLECNTNGDKLDAALLQKIFSAGMDDLYINLYDGPEQIEKFSAMLNSDNEKKVKFRTHWEGADHGLILNNRSGVITWLGVEEGDIAALAGTPCYYPFYKMFVDWNGDVLLCCNDWGREQIVGNVLQNSITSVWLSPTMEKIRKRLAKGDRTAAPCKKCNVKGTLFGKRSFDLINDYYESDK